MHELGGILSTGARRATWSISSGGSSVVFEPRLRQHHSAPLLFARLELLAPTFDFRVGENLADDATQKTFQVRVV